MPKHTFVITDESVNSYGFRMLSSGGDFDKFKKNPVMLYAHIRGRDRVAGAPILPIGRWDNIRQDQNRWLADADFDEDDAFAMQVAKKVEKGILNACSVTFEPIEFSEDPNVMVAGQTLPTVTKWIAQEISIADIPSNANAVKLSYNGVVVSLDDSQHSKEELTQLFNQNKKQTPSHMKTLIALINSMGIGLSLTEDANEGQIGAALNGMIKKHNEAIAAKDTKIQELTNQVNTYKQAAEAAESKALDDKAVALVDGAIGAKKILAAQKDQYVKLARADYDSTKAVIDSMQGYTSVNSQLNADAGKAVTELSKADRVKKFDDLFKSNELAALKQDDFATYELLFEAKYGKKPSK